MVFYIVLKSWVLSLYSNAQFNTSVSKISFTPLLKKHWAVDTVLAPVLGCPSSDMSAQVSGGESKGWSPWLMLGLASSQMAEPMAWAFGSLSSGTLGGVLSFCPSSAGCCAPHWVHFLLWELLLADITAQTWYVLTGGTSTSGPSMSISSPCPLLLGAAMETWRQRAPSLSAFWWTSVRGQECWCQKHLTFNLGSCRNIFISLVSHVITNTVVTWLFDNIYPGGCVVIYCIMIFICFSLMANDVEHLFISLLNISVSSLEKYLFRSFAHFKIGLFVLLGCKSSLYELEAISLSDIWVVHTFSRSVSHVFTPQWSTLMHKSFTFLWSQFIFSFSFYV